MLLSGYKDTPGKGAGPPGGWDFKLVFAAAAAVSVVSKRSCCLGFQPPVNLATPYLVAEAAS